jgi:clan AA aspartic protease (TIGR02281 family)
MGRRVLRAALAVGALVLEPVVAGPPCAPDQPEARLERATAPADDAAAATRSAAAVGGTRHDVPLRGDGKHLIVDGTLNGTVSGPMLIDTGASYCVLTPGTARRLGLRTGSSKRSVPVATANGKVDAELVELEAVEIEHARLAKVDAVVMDAVEPPLIGIVGLSFLTQFRFSVDPAQGTLRLEQ